MGLSHMVACSISKTPHLFMPREPSRPHSQVDATKHSPLGTRVSFSHLTSIKNVGILSQMYLLEMNDRMRGVHVSQQQNKTFCIVGAQLSWNFIIDYPGLF